MIISKNSCISDNQRKSAAEEGQLMEYEEEFHYLDSLTGSGIRLGLQRTEAVLSYLGNPHYYLNTIHVAGTNGKGSTAAIISSILEGSGYKVGLYTSPHLDNFQERIKINGISIPDERAGQLIRRVRQLIEGDSQGSSLTYFEFITAMALSYFAQKKVDIAILETGMGGRFDATNVVRPLVSVITSIGIDHTKYLGNTLLAIAREKAGIIKAGGRTVCAHLSPKVRRFMEEYCQTIEVKVRFYGKDFWVKRLEGGKDGQRFNFFSREKRYNDLRLSLLGNHQIINAATAIEVCHQLNEVGFVIQPGDIRRGLEKVCWEGRLEIMAYDPIIVLDGAHNPQAVKALVAAIKKIFSFKKIFIIFGVLQDKNYAIMIKNISSLFANNLVIIITKPSTPRGAGVDLVEKEFIKRGQKPIIIEDVTKAITQVKDLSTSEDIICITGSLYTVAEARKAIKSLGLDKKLDVFKKAS